MWTIDTVKDTLPPVPIRLGTQDYTGRIAGRRLPYAMVYVGETGYPFSWHTITRALNTGRALSVPAAALSGAGRAWLPPSLSSRRRSRWMISSPPSRGASSSRRRQHLAGLQAFNAGIARMRALEQRVGGAGRYEYEFRLQREPEAQQSVVWLERFATLARTNGVDRRGRLHRPGRASRPGTLVARRPGVAAALIEEKA